VEKKGALIGRHPAVVHSYDPDTRTCMVKIPGISDGGDTPLEAEIEYSLGDRSAQSDGKIATEVEILPGDPIWVDFIGGDPRYPVITGYRNPRVGNDKETRRWHHLNIEIRSDKDTVIKAGGNVTVICEKDVSVQAKGDIKGSAQGSISLEAQGDMSLTAGGAMKINGETVDLG